MFAVVPFTEVLQNLLAVITDRWLPFGTLKVHLFTNNIVPTPANVLADFVEPTGVNLPGYAPIPIAQVGTPFIDLAGHAVQFWTDAVFQPSASPPAPLTIYGYFVVDHNGAGPTVLLWSVRFDNPVIVALDSDSVRCDPDISQPPFSSQFPE